MIDSNHKRLTIFIDETDRWQGRNLAAAIVDRARNEGCAGATVFRGTAGYGVHGTVHTMALVDLAISLPVIILIIDEADKINKFLPMLEEMVQEGLIVIDDVQVIQRRKEKSLATQAEDAQTEHTVAEYMDIAPIIIHPETLVEEVIRILLDKHRAHLPVANDDGILLGLVSSQDLLGRIVQTPQSGFHLFRLRGEDKHKMRSDLRSLTASTVMRTQFSVVQENTPMFKAVSIMLHEKISALPVVREHVIVGMLRLPDLLQKALAIKYPEE
jgi:PII-like signaling protein